LPTNNFRWLRCRKFRVLTFYKFIKYVIANLRSRAANQRSFFL
jgi:hypothetical protein